MFIFLRRAYSVTARTRECYINELNDGISEIVLNRPEKMNSLGKQILAQLNECIDHVANKRVVIVKSACAKAFCSGADLKERINMNIPETEAFVDGLRNSFDKLANISVPTIACIDGIALGGGLELALACDMRIASSKSKLGLPETKLAIFPAAGGTQRLIWLVGPAKAKELIFTAEILSSQQAKELGILNHIAEDPSSLAFEIASKIVKNGPLGVAGAKRAINAQLLEILSNGLKHEKEEYSKILLTEDRMEGLRAFQEKRSPVYKGQ